MKVFEILMVTTLMGTQFNVSAQSEVRVFLPTPVEELRFTQEVIANFDFYLEIDSEEIPIRFIGDSILRISSSAKLRMFSDSAVLNLKLDDGLNCFRTKMPNVFVGENRYLYLSFYSMKKDGAIVRRYSKACIRRLGMSYTADTERRSTTPSLLKCTAND